MSDCVFPVIGFILEWILKWEIIQMIKHRASMIIKIPRYVVIDFLPRTMLLKKWIIKEQAANSWELSFIVSCSMFSLKFLGYTLISLVY